MNTPSSDAETTPSDSDTKKGSLLAGTAIVGGFTALSRILGFVRDLLIAALLGSSLAAEMFLVAFRIPNTLRSFFAEGALTSAFIPVFAGELEQSREKADHFFRQALGVMLTIILFVLAVFFFFSDTIVLFFAPGFGDDPETLSETARYLRIMLPYLPSITVVVMINGVLTSLHRYGAGSIAQVVVNLCLIAGALTAHYAPEGSEAEVLAWFVLGAAIVQYCVLFPMARSAGFPPIPASPLKALTKITLPIREMFTLMIPALLGAAVYQLTILMNTLLASFVAAGSIAWLFYADRIAQLPIGVFTIALSSVLLPQLSRSYARGDSEDSERRLSAALRYSTFFLTPLALGICAASFTIITLVFERGDFSSADSAQAALALRWYALGLLPLSLYSVLSRHFIAMKKTVIPAVIGAITLLFSFVISLSLMGEIVRNESSSVAVVLTKIQTLLPLKASLGHEGLALSSALSALISLSLAIFFLQQADRKRVLGALFGTWRAVVGAVLCFLLVLFIEEQLFSPVFRLSIELSLSIPLYFLITYLMKAREWEETLSAFRR